MSSNIVAGVALNRVDKQHLHKCAAEILKRDVAKMDVTSIILELTKKFAPLTKTDLATCGYCGGGSDNNLECCPFCLEPDEDEEEAVPVVAAKPPKIVAERPSRPTVVRVMRAVNGASNGVTGHADDETGHAMVLAKPAKVARPAFDPKKEQALTFAVIDVRRLIAEYSAKKEALSETGLDTAVSTVVMLRSAAAICWWRIGDYVRKVIFEPQLWSMRNDAEGKPLYKGFDNFVKTELGVTPNWIFRLMKISEQFTEDYMMAYGVFTLKMIANLPSTNQEEILGLIKSVGMKDRAGVWTLPGGVRSVDRLVKEYRAEKGLLKGVPKTNGDKAAPGAERKRSTLILEKPKFTLVGYKKDARDRPAKRLADQPVFILEGTQAKIQLTIGENAKGEVVLHAVYKRLTEE